MVQVWLLVFVLPPYSTISVCFFFVLVFNDNNLAPCMLVDVYSYDEEDMVEDCKIKEHLAHFGINIKNMEKVIMIFYFLTISVFYQLFPVCRFYINCLLPSILVEG